MPAKIPLRVSSIILFLFALGHTVGFQNFRPASPQGLAVLDAMRRVPFVFGSATVHWWDLYMGFGLALSVSGFFSAVLAWRLSNYIAAEQTLVRTITWLLCATQVGSIAISLRYFSTVQAVFSVVSTAALAWSAVRLKEANSASSGG